MRWDDLGRQDCSLARTLAVIGDRWTLMILRDAFLRVRRFEDFEQSLKIARRVLSERLALLVAHGILAKVAYQERPLRREYRLTEKGLELYPALVSLVHWGDKHYPAKGGPPVLHRHLACGHTFRSVMTCSECAAPVAARDVAAQARRGVVKRPSTARETQSHRKKKTYSY
jgi:DNA-binding HxlR family transcriptional regulator